MLSQCFRAKIRNIMLKNTYTSKEHIYNSSLRHLPASYSSYSLLQFSITSEYLKRARLWL